VVPALNETAPATLGKLTTAQELRPATDGSLLVLVDWSVKRGEWSSSLAFGASKADNAYDLSWRIREPAMDAARPAAMNESPAINDGSILIALSERALLASTLTPAMRIMSLLRSFDPGTPAQPPAASQRTAALRKVNGKLRLDAILPSRAEPSDPRAIDRAVLGFVASIENKPAQELTLDARVPRMTEVIPEQGTILRAVMGDRLNLWWSPELGTATLAGAADEALPAWTPANMPRETTWLSAGRIRPRELIASIPPDMRDRVGMIGLRSVMESIDTIDWTMSLQGEGDKAHVRGTGRLTLSPAKPK
jgi:hypothetical protein